MSIRKCLLLFVCWIGLHDAVVGGQLSKIGGNLPSLNGAYLSPAQAGDPSGEIRQYECPWGTVPTSLSWEHPSVRVEEDHVSFEAKGHAAETIIIRNVEPRPVETVALVVEYLDSQENVIEQVPLVVGTAKALGAFRAPFAVQGGAVAVSDIPGISQWEGPLGPGELASIGGIEDGIRTAICPARARITYLQVQFSDGTSQTMSSPGWKVGPLPRRIPRSSKAAVIPKVDLPRALLAEVKISADGAVLNVVANDRGQDSLFDWVQDYMKESWKFYPALSDGKPVTSDLHVLFCFHAHVKSDLCVKDANVGTVTLIHFYPRRELYPNDTSPEPFVVAYGELNEDSLLNDVRR